MNAQSPTSANDPLSQEDHTRANMYALIGRLFYAAPDSNLLAEIGQAGASNEGASGELQLAWQALQDACVSASPTVIKQEHDILFVGIGKAEVTPYTSHYVTHNAPDRHLVALREQLQRWGLARSSGVFEVEDHVAGLCDVMRFLIEEQMSLADQRLFFERYVYPGMPPLGTAVMAAASAGFYKRVVAFANAFFEVEKAAFEMDDSTTRNH